MSRWTAAFGMGVILVLSMTFAALNGGQRVTIRLGVATFYQVPLTTVVLGALIVGMVAMLVAGITSDLRVRRILRNRLAEERDEEQARMFVDRNQITMFPEEDPD
ncbi:MAG TPA: lipopolysaccharide assembly protein LapA domain-containing protein [Myxococcota bacterium]|nr:lipopolysaccharide assembly protein LapA domain-containing protein [Myxococcota bacterium]HKK94346.1 lipopolysaccharide assembly protein LapA domain-containing protein [Longimicrobiales bacterium]